MNQSHVNAAIDQTKGKVKEAIGNATGNDRLANSGALDQIKGHAEEAWGNVKDAASNLRDSARTSANTTAYEREADARADSHQANSSLRDKVTAGAEHVKDSINRGLNNLQDRR
jgi:uncharacterized protein YjbJ (UPF0337 family)